MFKEKHSILFLAGIPNNKKIGTSVLNPGAGFLRIFTAAIDRLFEVRLDKC